MEYNESSAVNLTDLKTEGNFSPPLPIYRIIAGLLPVTVIFGSLGNLVVASTILKKKYFRKPVYALLLQVSALSVLFQTLDVPIDIYSFFHSSWTPSTALCAMTAYLTYILLCKSSLLLMLVSVYRFVLVFYNDLYTKIKNPWVVTTLFGWVETVLMISVLGKKVFFYREFMTCVLEGANLQTFLLIFIYIPMTLIPIAMYTKIAVFVRKTIMRVLPSGSTSSENHLKSYKLTRLTHLISLNHLVTGVLPGIFCTVIKDNLALSRHLAAIALFLFRLTAAFDVIIYIFSNRPVRSMIMNIFRSLRPRFTPRDTQHNQILDNEMYK